MDPAVDLVQAHLRVNGHFTVSEYPVLACLGADRYQMATDLDILAFRFAGAGRHIPGDRGIDLRSESFTLIRSSEIPWTSPTW